MHYAPATTNSLGVKEQTIMKFLHDRVFDPVLASPTASKDLKRGIRYTVMRMRERDAVGMVSYFWAAIRGTERAIGFAAKLKKAGFLRFEEALEEFRLRFDDRFLRR